MRTLTSVLALLPFGIEVSEIVFLAGRGGISWEAVVLAILDVGAIAMIVIPWVYETSVEAAPRFCGGSFIAFFLCCCPCLWCKPACKWGCSFFCSWMRWHLGHGG